MKRSLLPSLLALALTACFTGETTFGSACRSDADCGDDQACARGFCGKCGDGTSQGGEICLEPLEATAQIASVVAVADFDEDGRGDLLIESAGVRSLLLGTDVGFDRQELPASAALHRLLIPGDVDVDAHADVVGLTADGARGTILFGDGAGGLVELDVPELAGAVDLRIADGAIWAAVAERVVVLRVTDRVVSPGPELALAAGVEHLIGPVLMDNDDRPDLLAVLETGAVALLLADENGGFSANEGAGFSGAVLDTWLSDVNADGRPELIGLVATGDIEVLTSGQDGSLSAGFSFPTAPGATRIALFDVNADRLRDVLVFGGTRGLFVHPGLLRGFDPAVEIGVDADLLDVTQLRVGPDAFPDLVTIARDGPITVLEATP